MLFFENEFFGTPESFGNFFYKGEFDILYCLRLDGVVQNNPVLFGENLYFKDTSMVKESGRIVIENDDYLIVYKAKSDEIGRAVKICSNKNTVDKIIGATRSEFDSWFKKGKERKARLIKMRS